MIDTSVIREAENLAAKGKEIGDGVRALTDRLRTIFIGKKVRIKVGKYKGYRAIIDNAWIFPLQGEVLFPLKIISKRGGFISKGYYSKRDARRYYSFDELEFL